MGLLAVSALATGTGRQSKDKNGLVDVRCPEGAHSDSLGRSPRSAIPILVHPLAPAAAKPQQAPRGMEAIWATSTWGCAPGCPRAPLRDSMQRLGGVSTRKVTSHNPKNCASPPAPALPGTSAPQPEDLRASPSAGASRDLRAPTRKVTERRQRTGPYPQPEDLRVPPSAGAPRDFRAPTRKVTHLTVFYVAEDRVLTEAPKGRTTIAWGAAPGLRSLFLFTPWRLLRRSRSRRQGDGSDMGYVYLGLRPRLS